MQIQGAASECPLTQGNDGNFYGTTDEGGSWQVVAQFSK